ncbi:hypothetical protein [Cupriavidus metallidurans]|uniref:hypothetical protein n=1 Tax=Cupriavidus metallidurans TaxID=119219 RepID=UPI001F1DF4DF|nr:hypothetical protein [Cupriavidus metallidurans]
MRELFLAWRSLIVTALIAFALGIGAGYWLHGSVQGASETVVAKAETRTVQADAVAAVDSAQQKDAALAKRQDDIQAQTNDALKKVAQYAKRPATPARSTAPASASARDPADPHAIQPEMCWADQHLSVGTVSVLNSARAGVPIDSAALPGDAEGRAYSGTTSWWTLWMDCCADSARH